MLFHIYGPLSQTREPPMRGTEEPQGSLIPQQAQGSRSRFFKLPLHVFYICDAPGMVVLDRSTYMYLLRVCRCAFGIVR